MSPWGLRIVAAVFALAVIIFVWQPIGHGQPTWRTLVVRCRVNLHEIGAGCRIYAESPDHRAYPWAEPGGLASLQALADAEPGLTPSSFVCPATGDVPARPGLDGKYRLDEGNSSYGMVPWKLLPSDPPDSIVAFDRTPCHEGKRNVLTLDGSVEFLDEETFLAELGRQAAGRGAARPGGRIPVDGAAPAGRR